MVTDRELVKLREDLDRWVAQGVISPARRDAILAEVAATPAKRRGGLSVMPFFLGMFIAAGATVTLMSFLDPALIPRPLAILILLISVGAAVGLAHWLAARERAVPSQVAILAALGLFGASLFLIVDIYFIHVHPPDLVVVWALAALIAAVVLPSRGALAVAIVTATVWSVMEVQVYRNVFHWEYLLIWAIATGWTISLRWRTGLHLAAAGIAIWSAINMIGGARQLLSWGDLDVLGLLIIGSTALWVAGRYLETRPFPFPRTLEYYGLTIALVSMFMLRFYGQFQAPYPVWQMFAGFSALTTVALALATFTRDRGAMVATMALLLTGMLYPNIAPLPELADSLFAIQHGLFIILALWMVTHGVRMRDSVIVAIGLAGLCAETVDVYAAMTGAGPGDNVLIGMGFVLLVIVAAAAVTVHRTLFKEGRQSTTGESS